METSNSNSYEARSPTTLLELPACALAAAVLRLSVRDLLACLSGSRSLRDAVSKARIM